MSIPTVGSKWAPRHKGAHTCQGIVTVTRVDELFAYIRREDSGGKPSKNTRRELKTWDTYFRPHEEPLFVDARDAEERATEAVQKHVRSLVSDDLTAAFVLIDAALNVLATYRSAVEDKKEAAE